MRRMIRSRIVFALCASFLTLLVIPVIIHASVVWQAGDSADRETLIYTPAPNGVNWFDNTLYNPIAFLGVWDRDDFTTNASTTIRLQLRWNGVYTSILDVLLRTSAGGDPFYGGAAPLAEIVYIPPNDGYYRLLVQATSTLQEYTIPATEGSTIHQGDELWMFLYPSDASYGANHWIGTPTATTTPHARICQGECEEETTTPVCVENCFSNVLFLPGIESSRLYRPQIVGADENKLWEPGGDDDVRDLYLKEDGEGYRNDVYTKEGQVIDEIPVVGQNIYKSFIAKMDELKSSGQINDWLPAAYDWRLSLDDILNYGNNVDGQIYYSGNNRATSTPYIIQELRRLAASSKSGKVTIIAHSNGGLVAKQLTNVLGDEAADLIDKMIFVAVPQAGTPMAAAAGLHGYDQALGPGGLAMSEQVARSFASTSSMFYHLLPSAQYFTYVDDPIIQFDPSLTDWIERYGDVIHSGERLHHFLVDSYGRVDAQTGDTDQPIQFSEDLLSQAETLHDDLDNWTPPGGVELIQVAGWGVDKTVSGITYKQKGSGVQPNMNFTIDGDGTVVVPSALWTSAATGTERYWLDLAEYNRLFNKLSDGRLRSIAHGDIFEVNELNRFIVDKITSVEKPLDEYTYLFTEPPLGDQLHLRYALHSPLTLDMYDDQGRHTGVSTTTGQIEENIPGTYYAAFGDTKYIFSDASTSAHVLMDGYADGVFTFNVDELEGDMLVASTTFKDIPASPETLVSIDTEGGVSSLSPLHIDDDGDGTTDVSLEPKLDGVVTMSTPPTTSASTTGTLGENDWYTNNVLVTFTTTDPDGDLHATYSILDENATTTGSSVLITEEGTHVLRYYSDDNAGTVEAEQMISVKIDKTPPEITILPATMARDISFIGTDNFSSTTVDATGKDVIVTDAAGHTTKLTFEKKFSGTLLTHAKLASIQYDNANPLALPSSFLYVWDAGQSLISQTVTVTGGVVVEAVYKKKKDKMTIVYKEKGKRIKAQTLNGFIPIKLTTNKGATVYEW